jgi:predicted alpha/beta superfamily hydrolase
MTQGQTPSERTAVRELGAASIRGSKSFGLASCNVDQTFIIDVAPPPGPISPVRPLPLVFVLDGDSMFGLVAQTSLYLQMDPGGLPPAQGESRAGHGERTRDLTPSVDQRYLAMLRAAPAPFTLPPTIKPGGAPAFLSFIKGELVPFLAERYPIDRDDQTIVGMSLGGLFALHVLFSEPTAFRRYIAASPALWWDDGLLFREEAELASVAGDLPANLYLSVGSLEETTNASARMVSNVADLSAVLQHRQYPSLQLTHQVFADESHMSVLPLALSHGLRAVFDRNSVTASWARLPAG